MRARRYFEPGEDVLYASRPHPVVLTRAVVLSLLVLAACVAGFVAWKSAPTWFGAVLGLVALGVSAALGRRVLHYRSTLLLVTTRRVVARRGVLGRSGRELTASRVVDVASSEGLLGRLLGYGDLAIEVSGEGAAMAFHHVRRPELAVRAVHRAVEAADLALERARQVEGAVTGSPDAAETASPLGRDRRLELLETMRRRGMVSELEFAEKRAELLRGA